MWINKFIETKTNLETFRERIVLNEELDLVGRFEERHDGLFVSAASQVLAVHFQQSVSEPQLTTLIGYATSNNLELQS